MLKKAILLILVGIVAIGANAQSDLFKSKVKNLPNYDNAPYHFGFVLALNQMHFTINPLDNLHQKDFISEDATDVLPSPNTMNVLGINYEPEYGFTVGIIGNLRLGRYFDLRFIPSLAFGERVLEYRIANHYNNSPSDTITMNKRIPSTYVEFPLMIKYKSKRYNNVRGYVLGGAKYSIDLAPLGNKDVYDSNNRRIMLDRQDAFFEIGVGFDFYLSFFKFGMEIKMAYSPFDTVKGNGNLYTDSIKELNSKYFQLSFTFE